MKSIRVTFQRSNPPILQKTAKRNIVRYPAKLNSVIFLILFHLRKTNIPTKDEFFAKKIFSDLLQLLALGSIIFFPVNIFCSLVCTFSLHEHKCLFGHVNILQLQIQALPEESNYFCAIKIYSNTSKEMQKYCTFKRVFLQCKTSEIQYFFTAPEMFE